MDCGLFGTSLSLYMMDMAKSSGVDLRCFRFSCILGQQTPVETAPIFEDELQNSMVVG